MTISEICTVETILSAMSLKELLNAARIGFESLSEKDETSNNAELAILCTFLEESI